MAAGSGVEHSEFNPSTTAATRLLQIWILPDAKGVEPRYAEKNLAARKRENCIWSPAKPAATVRLKLIRTWIFAGQTGGRPERRTFAGPGPPRVGSCRRRRRELNGTKLTGGDAVGVGDEKLLGIAASKPSQVLVFDLN